MAADNRRAFWDFFLFTETDIKMKSDFKLEV